MLRHPGFHMWLPERVRLAPTTVVESTETGVRFRRNEIMLTLALAAPARKALLAALDEDGGGMVTTNIAAVWHQLLEKLAAAGMLVDAAPSACKVSGLDAVVAVLDRIYAEKVEYSLLDNGVAKFVRGECGNGAGFTWLVENYHFTKSAGYHISPVLRHQLLDSERMLWTRFLEDESWHWRIYRPASAMFGLRLADLDALPRLGQTEQLIESVRAAAELGSLAYAAVTTFLEKPPPSSNAAGHPFFSSLMENYGYTAAAIRPLWWHQTENIAAGHCSLGPIVISNRGAIDPDELEAAITAMTDVIHASHRWHDQMFADC